MPLSAPNEEILDSLRKLLLLRPESEATSSQMIFSTTPAIWAGLELRSTQIIDMSALIDVPSPWTGIVSTIPRSSLEEFVLEKLLRKGWPGDQIKMAYRGGPKLEVRFDIALCNESGKVVCAVDVVGIHRRRGGLESQAQRILNNFDVDAVCVAGGSEFLLCRRDAPPVTSSDPPSPEEFGLVSNRQVDHSSSAMRPLSLDSLHAIMEEHSPHHCVIDYSMPWGRPQGCEYRFARELPQTCLAALPHQMEPAHAILGWLAGLKIPSVSMITAPSLAWAESYRSFREFLSSSIPLHACIELPAGVFAPITTIRPSYFLFRANSQNVFFHAIDSPSEVTSCKDRPWFQSLSNWLSGADPVVGFTNRLIDLDTWSVAGNDPTVARIRERFSAIENVVPLRDAFDVVVGQPIGRSSLVEDPSLGAVQVLDAAYVRAVARRESADSPKWVGQDIEIRERHLLRSGDVLLPRIVSSTASAIVFNESFPAVAGTSVLVFRPKDGSDPIALAEFLNSRVGHQLLQSISPGTSVPQLSIAAVRELPVPNLDIDLAGPIAEVEQVCAQLQNALDRILTARCDLFGFESASDLHGRVRDLRVQTSLLNDSLRLAGSLDFQIAQFFPFPLAFGFRLLASYVDPRKRIQEQFRFAETLLAFLGSLSIALLSDEDRRTLSSHLRECWQGGISHGAWQGILGRSSKALAGYQEHPLAESICALNAGKQKSGFGKAVSSLVNARNDWHHGRGPSTDDAIVTLSEELQQTISECMKALRFLTQYPIRQVVNIDGERRSTRVLLHCLRIVGEHQGFRQEMVPWHSPMARGDLYLELSDRSWVNLFPYMQVLSCALCKTEEMYFIDRWDNGSVVMKSFERGHTSERRQLHDDLSDIFPTGH